MQKLDFNQGWLFERIGAPASAAKAVALPHDAMLWETRDPHCANGNATGFYPGGSYRYCKYFTPDVNWADKAVVLEFEGVYQNAVVLLNGQEIARRPYGYSNFSADLTGRLQQGENTLEVLVDNSGEPNTRWYSGSGIYRPVWLYSGGPEHIDIDGIEVTTISHDPAVIQVRTRANGGTASVTILRNGAPVASGQGFDLQLEIPDAALWSAETPELYTCEVQLSVNGTVTDTAHTAFGICHRSWSPQGLLINGTPTKLRGSCIHSDNGILGACEFPAAALRRAKILKEAGFNAIRSAHNPLSRTMLDACDQIGLYVMDELCDMWYDHKNRYDYACHFEQWHTQDLTAMVRKDISHPSVVMYSIGNEVTETAEPSGIAYTKEMADLCRRLDSSRPVTCGINMALNVMHFAGLGVYRPAPGETVRPPEPKNPKALALMAKMAGARQKQAAGSTAADSTNSGTAALGLSAQAGERKDGKLVGSEYFNEMMRTMKEQQRAVVSQPIARILSEEAYAALDIAGYNYGDGRYEQDAVDYPDRVSVGTETLPQRIFRNWRMVEKLPYLVGDFMWTGWDYLGEAGVGAFCYDSVGNKDKSYPALLAGSGVIDITGQPRPEVWLNKAVFGLSKQPYIGVEPVTHAGENKLISAWRFSDAVRSWSWPGCEGRTAEIIVYADAAEVELLQDGRSIGRAPVNECQAHFTAVYAPGTLTAVAYDANGQEQGCDSLSSAAEELCLTVQPDKTRLAADGQDLCYLSILLTDRSGIVQASPDREVTVAVSGAATLAGLGSADPFNSQPYTAQSHRTYYGRLQAVIRAGVQSGPVEVDIASGELHQHLTLNVAP